MKSANRKKDLPGWEGDGDGDGEKTSKPLPPNRWAQRAAQWRRGAPEGVRGDGEIRASRSVDRVAMTGEAEPTIDWAAEDDGRAALIRHGAIEVPKVAAKLKSGRKTKVAGTLTLEEWRQLTGAEEPTTETEQPVDQDFVTQSRMGEVGVSCPVTEDELIDSGDRDILDDLRDDLVAFESPVKLPPRPAPRSQKPPWWHSSTPREVTLAERMRPLPRSAPPVARPEAGPEKPKCSNCGDVAGTLRKGLCMPCYQYQRRHRGELPSRAILRRRDWTKEAPVAKDGRGSSTDSAPKPAAVAKRSDPVGEPELTLEAWRSAGRSAARWFSALSSADVRVPLSTSAPKPHEEG